MNVTDHVWTGAGGPFPLRVDRGVFFPSSTTRVIASALEILPGESVLDVGCGCGVLGLVAARLGAGRVVGCDAAPTAVRCARANAARCGLGDIAEFRVGHLLEPVADMRADVVIADVSGVPDPIALATGWFPDNQGGGPTGAELPVQMLADLPARLAPGGRVYLPTGTIQDEGAVLAAARRVFGERMEPVARREFPLPDAVVATPAVQALIEDGVLRLGTRGSRRTWRLTVWRCGT